MKIGFDISDLSTSRADGTTRYTYELAKLLPKLDPNISWVFFAPTSSASIKEIAQAQNVTLSLTPWPKYWTQARLPFDLYRHKIDTLFMPIQQIPFIRPRKMRTVAVIHDLAVHLYPEQFTYKDWALLHIFSAYVAREADELIAVSQATALDVEKFYKRKNNVHVIHHGVDHAKFQKPAELVYQESWNKLHAAHPKLQKPYLLYVGQIQPRKNLIHLIESFEILKKNHSELQLVLAGGHGWLQQPILDRVQSSPHKNDIIATGPVAEELLPALYWHANVFTLVSLYEGFGLPLLEAMSSGTPVVTSNVSSMPEIVGQHATLVDSTDVHSIVQGLETAMNQSQQITSEALVHAQKFTWEDTARKTLAILTNKPKRNG